MNDFEILLAAQKDREAIMSMSIKHIDVVLTTVPEPMSVIPNDWNMGDRFNLGALAQAVYWADTRDLHRIERQGVEYIDLWDADALLGHSVFKTGDSNLPYAVVGLRPVWSAADPLFGSAEPQVVGRETGELIAWKQDMKREVTRRNLYRAQRREEWEGDDVPRWLQYVPVDECHSAYILSIMIAQTKRVVIQVDSASDRTRSRIQDQILDGYRKAAWVAAGHPIEQYGV